MLDTCLIYYLLIFYLKFTHRLHQRKLHFILKFFHPYKTINNQGTDEQSITLLILVKPSTLGPPYLLPTSVDLV
jgi:hypothetical protein